MAPRAMNGGGGEPPLASVIERSAELKRALVDFALSPRFERHLEQYVSAFELPPELADSGTIGIIYDEADGLNFYNEYGMLRALFADPALAAGEQYTDVLRGYLRSETIGPLPFRRLAAAHPDTADAVFRKVPRRPNFTWAEHGEALMRRRKPWYYEREPRPGTSVIGARLSELVRR
jgi:hypothetical protein